jgi:hypothetical protein
MRQLLLGKPFLMACPPQICRHDITKVHGGQPSWTRTIFPGTIVPVRLSEVLFAWRIIFVAEVEPD